MESIEKEYFAFISYKSEDVEWATWLQHELEHYHLPASYNGRTDVTHELRPIFRDIDELSAGNLPKQIKQALFNSQNLIVICSPQAAESPWVNEEVETFISLGRTDRIFPFIVEGNSPKEFFPPSLLNLPKNEERLGGDVSKKGRDAAFVKVVAGMLGVGFDSLWNRYEKEKAEEERKIREQRDNLLRVQSQFLAEKANVLVNEGDTITATILALEALPNDFRNLDRPFVIEAEASLRTCMIQKSWQFKVRHEHLFLSSMNNVFYLVTLNKEFIEITSIDFANKKLQEKIKVKYKSNGLLAPRILFGEVVAFSASSHKFAFLEDFGKRITIVDIESNKVGLSINACHSIEEHLDSVYISKDGNYIIGARRDKAERVFLYIWDTVLGQLIGQMPIQLKKCNKTYKYLRKICITCKHIFVPCGEYIYIVDMENYKNTRILKGHSSLIDDIDINKDGSKVVSISNDGEVIFWGNKMLWKQKYDVILKIKQYTNTIGHVQFSPDNNSLLVSYGKEIYILNTNNFIIRKKIEGISDKILSVSYNGDYVVLSTVNNTIKIWDVSDKKLILHKMNWSCSNQHIVGSNFYYYDTNKIISSDRSRLVFTESFAFENRFIIYDIKDNKIVFYTNFMNLAGSLREEIVNNVCLNDDGNLVAFILTLGKDNFKKKYYIEIWNTKTNKLRNRLDFFEEDTSIFSISFLKTDIVTMVICTSTGLYLWKECDQFPRKISDKLFFYCISGNSTNIIVLCNKNGMEVYDYGKNLFKTINLNCSPYIHYYPVMSPDDNIIYLKLRTSEYTYIDYKIDRSTGKIVTRFTNESLCPNSFASLSADGKWFLKCYGNEIRVIDAKTYNILITYTPCFNAPPYAEHQPSNQKFKKRNNQIDWAIFNKDGDTVLFSVDGDILYWEFPPINQITSGMRNLFKDNPLTQLSPEDRKKYHLEKGL